VLFINPEGISYIIFLAGGWMTKKPKKTKPKKTGKLKCCRHCPDHKYCKDKNGCCEYCDYLVNNKCIYGKKDKIVVGITSGKIQLSDYRGDDYGIDDYSEYDLGDD